MKPSRETPIAKTITLLEQEVEAIEQRRGELLRVIDTLRPLAGDGRTSTPGRSARAAKRRTDGRTEQSSRRRATRSRPDWADHEGAILNALRAKSPQRPGELATRLKLDSAVLRYRLKPLLKRGAVLATGKTMNRQLALPRLGAAKEAP